MNFWEKLKLKTRPPAAETRPETVIPQPPVIPQAEVPLLQPPASPPPETLSGQPPASPPPETLSGQPPVIPQAEVPLLQPPASPPPETLSGALPEDKSQEQLSLIDKFKAGLTKTRQNLTQKIQQLFTFTHALDDAFWEELEEVLLSADMSFNSVEWVMQRLKQTVKEEHLTQPEEVKAALKTHLTAMLQQGDAGLTLIPGSVSVLLIVGVNGTGKTTSIAKLTQLLKNSGRKLLLAAADTFRAGAIEQLEIWGKKTGVEVIKNLEGSDPAAVVFDALNAAKARGVEVLIVDTAGRLHSKVNLMEELKKIGRVVHKEIAHGPSEVLLVLDATTGQNALVQARAFTQAVGLTGVILTKMDGTAKGGTVFSIVQELKLPVKYIGLGEGIDDLKVFDPELFVSAILD